MVPSGEELMPIYERDDMQWTHKYILIPILRFVMGEVPRPALALLGVRAVLGRCSLWSRV